MSKPVVYMDECGHTGSNLDDSEQPCFAIGSHSLSEDESTEFVSKFFRDAKGAELKHAVLVKSAKGRKMMLSFLEALAPDRVLLGIADKRYCLLLKIVEHIVEPAFFARGVNLYVNGENLRMASAWASALSRDPVLTSRLLTTFQAMVRDFNRVTEWAFRRVVFEEHHDPIIESVVFEILRKTLTALEDRDLSILDSKVLQLGQAVALPLVSHWKSRLGDFKLIHDESFAMSKDRELWDLLTGSEAPAATVGGPGWSVSYPQNLEPTEFRTSVGSRALQLADVIAGATARYGASKIRGGADAYADDVERRFMIPAEEQSGRLFGTALFPLSNEDFENLPATPAGTVDAVAHSVDALLSSRARRD